MPETKDPVAALDASDIPTRAAGARDLCVSGGPAHIDRLLEMATTDKSPGVRLACAAAAADVLSRDRIARAIPEEDRRRWLAVVQGVDAGVNTGLFQVAAGLNLPEAVNRVIVGLRDPRHDVRAGACVGLWRLVGSAAANGDDALQSRVVATVSDGRARVETRVEIARICANAGYNGALDGARAAAGEAIRNTRVIADEVVARLESPPQPSGIYVDRGVDNGEVRPAGRGAVFMAVLSPTDVVLARGKVSRGAPASPFRVLSGKFPSAERFETIVQTGTTTWWSVDGDELCAFGDQLVAAGAFDLLEACDALLGQSAAALRVRGVALLAQGRTGDAVAALEAAVAGKKVPADAPWFLAEALHTLGRDHEARPHLEKYLSKAARNSKFVREAKARLGIQ